MYVWLLTTRDFCGLGSRPYLETAALPVGGAGAGGGGFSPGQQLETPSVAAAKATKLKYFTMFIGRSIDIACGHERAC